MSMTKGTGLIKGQWFYCPVNCYTGVMLTQELFVFVPNEKVAQELKQKMYLGISAIDTLEWVVANTTHRVNIGHVDSLTHNVELLKSGEYYDYLDDIEDGAFGDDLN